MLWFDVELIVLTTDAPQLPVAEELWFDVELIVLTTTARRT